MIRYAVANGNWSSTSTWDGGTLPSSTDDVYANNHTVSINQDITVNSLQIVSNTSPSITAGGTFNISTARSVTVTAGILSSHSATFNGAVLTVAAGTNNVSITAPTLAGGGAGYSNAVVVTDLQTGGTLTITGDIIASATAGAQGLYVWGNPATVIINGDVTGASGAEPGALFQMDTVATNITITGNVTGGSVGHGLATDTSARLGTLTINGTVTGGSGSNAYGAQLGAWFSPGGHAVINGDVKGGTAYGAPGVYAYMNQVDVTIRGNVIPGNYSQGCPAIDTTNSGSKQIRISGDIWAGGAGTAPGPEGYWPISGKFVAIDGESLSIHLLDDAGFPSGSGGTQVDFAEGGGSPTFPSTGQMWP